ncbi:MAG: hypothetical protein P8Y79_08390 [Ignavibacteriaceae bacterium]
MFKLKSFPILFIGLYLFTSGVMLAQEETKDQLFWVREEVAKIDKWGQYEKTSKEWVDLMTEGGLDLPVVRASQRNDGHYYYLIPLSNYAEIDKFPEIFGSAIDKIGKEKWGKYMEEANSSMESHKDFIAKWSAKYSYVPKAPRTKPEEAGFIHWLFFHYKLEKKQDVLDVLADWKALYEKNNIPDGWGIWLVELGLDNNMIALSEVAKDAGSYYAAMKENSEKLKEEEAKLWQRMSVNILDIKEVYGKPRPDLTYIKK